MDNNIYSAEYQEEPEINMLPCRWQIMPLYWLMTISCAISIVVAKYTEYKLKSFPFMDLEDMGELKVWVMVLPVVATYFLLLFSLLFAKGCKNLNHKVPMYTKCIVGVFVAFLVTLVIKLFMDGSTVMTIAGFILKWGIVGLSFPLAQALRKYYRGMLEDIGDSLWKFSIWCLCGIGFSILLLVLAYWSGNDAGGQFIRIVFGVVDVYILYLFFSSLWKISKILNSGYSYLSSEGELNSSAHVVEPDNSTDKHYDSNIVLIIIGAVVFVLIICILGFCLDKPDRDTNDSTEYNDYEYVDNVDAKADDYSDQEEYGTNNQEEYGVNNDEQTLADISLPTWLPDNIREDLESSYYVFFDSDGDMSLSGSYNGSINDSKIIMELSYNNDGTVTGRYAYKSTLDRYGTGDSSWYKLRGAVFYAKMSNPRVVLRSYAPDSGKLFEYFDLTNEDMTISGTMFNVRHLENPTKSLYKVYLER